MTALAPDTLDVPALLAKLHATPRRITADSRRVEAGVAFAAYPGTRADGRRFVPDAMARGATAVLWEPAGFAWDRGWQVPHLPVDGLQQRLGAIADFIYGSPSQDLWMTGVTGTNGKTSCAHWIGHAFDACGRRAGILGTLGNGLIGALAPAAHTTPDAPALHELLRQFKAAGATTVAMEVSSHGLDQGRVNGIRFDVALFTNLTRDHLDYHRTMAAYGQAKAKLFSWPGLRTAVINADDPFGQSLIDAARARGTRLLTYGLAAADIAATEIRMSGNGIALAVGTPWGKADFAAAMVGTFNAQNLLGVLGVLLASDVPLETATAALARLEPPAGRMQRLGGIDRPLVVVDYAHTPDALEKVLSALRPAVRAPGELICVFGCGGDRDAGKRPEMGHVAARFADRVVVTSDNPRSEDPAAIVNAIARGVRDEGNRRWTIEIDRAVAIRNAIGAARMGDVVLIAGKGHETYQENQGVRTAFSDAGVAAAALSAWSAA
jgi:UDP-N-acetylmuramyl-tripeptide synthetase